MSCEEDASRERGKNKKLKVFFSKRDIRSYESVSLPRLGLLALRRIGQPRKPLDLRGSPLFGGGTGASRRVPSLPLVREKRLTWLAVGFREKDDALDDFLTGGDGGEG